MKTEEEIEDIIDVLLFEPKKSLDRLKKINSSKKLWTKELLEEYKQLKKEEVKNKIIISVLEELKQKLKEKK